MSFRTRRRRGRPRGEAGGGVGVLLSVCACGSGVGLFSQAPGPPHPPAALPSHATPNPTEPLCALDARAMAAAACVASTPLYTRARAGGRAGAKLRTSPRHAGRAPLRVCAIGGGGGECPFVRREWDGRIGVLQGGAGWEGGRRAGQQAGAGPARPPRCSRQAWGASPPLPPRPLAPFRHPLCSPHLDTKATNRRRRSSARRSPNSAWRGEGIWVGSRLALTCGGRPWRVGWRAQCDTTVPRRGRAAGRRRCAGHARCVASHTRCARRPSAPGHAAVPTVPTPPSHPPHPLSIPLTPFLPSRPSQVLAVQAGKVRQVAVAGPGGHHRNCRHLLPLCHPGHRHRDGRGGPGGGPGGGHALRERRGVGTGVSGGGAAGGEGPRWPPRRLPGPPATQF